MRNFQKLAPFILSFLFFANTVQAEAEAEYKFTASPEWVAATDYAVNETSSGSAVDYLLVDQQANMLDKPIKYYRYVNQIKAASGLSQVSQIYITYNPDYQDIEFHKFSVKRGTEVITLTKDKLKIRTLSREEELQNNIYLGLTTLVVILDNIRVGDVLDYSYSLKGSNPIFENRIFGSMGLGWSVKVGHIHNRILVNSDKKLNFKFHGSKLSLEEKVADGVREYFLDIKDAPANIDEHDYPFGYVLYPYFEYSEFNGWKDVAKWAKSIYPENQKLPDELLAMLNQIKSESPDKKEQVSKALQFVQNDIRYLSLSLGENSHRPHNLDEIFEKRYGDCKDKAYLLQAMLAELGVESYPALVSSTRRASINDALPAPDDFDHVILRVDDKKVGKYWLDGTRSFQSSPLDLLGKMDFGYALLVKDKETKLTRMYKDAPVESHISVFEDIYAADYTSPVTLKLKVVFSGNSAEHQRYRFSVETIEEVTKVYENFYLENYTGTKSTSQVETEDLVDKNEFVVTAEFEIPDYFIHEGRKITAPLRVAYYKDYLVKPQVLNRHSPFFIGPPAELITASNVHFPHDIGADHIDDTVELSNSLFEFRSHYRYSNNTFTVSSKLKLTGGAMQPDELNDYMDAADTMYDEMHGGIFFFEGDESSSHSYSSLAELKSEAESGNADAQVSLGRLYFYGQEGVKEDAKKGVQWFKKAAEQGDGLGQYYFGVGYYYGKGIKQSYDDAFMWLMKSAKNNVLAAQYDLGQMYFNGESVSKNPNQAFNWFQSAAMGGHLNAKVMIGYMYEYGIGVKQSYKDALKWYQEASKEGHERATFYIASMYLDGRGVKEDFDKGFSLLKESAEAGDVYAEYVLGNMYYQGNKVKQDFLESFKWFELAAKQNHSTAQVRLGYQYDQGLGVGQNKKIAFDYYLSAAEGGNFDAMYNVGIMYKYGDGISASNRKSDFWFKKGKHAYEVLASEGDSHAQELLGKLYYYGHGVEADFKKARFLFEKAAVQNNHLAQLALGDIYRYGYGVEINLNTAMEWYEKSSKNGNQSAAKALKELKK